MRRRQNNPILTGEAGVGKTAVVEGFALRVARGDVPPPLQNVSIRGLDLALLQAGAGVKGEFENRLKGLIEEVKASPSPIILFIDEAHTLIGAGGAEGQGDAANLLKPALARGELRTIAATTWSEYKKYFEKDAALARRFQVVKVEEPSEAACCVMLRGLVPMLEKHHGVSIGPHAISAAVSLTRQFVPAKHFPGKAVDALDHACARFKQKQAINQQFPGMADVASMRHLGTSVGAYDVLKTVQENEGVDIVTPMKDMKNQLAARLKANLPNQDEAVFHMTNLLINIKLGFRPPLGPSGVLAIAGSSAPQRAAAVAILAKAIFGNADNVTIFGQSGGGGKVSTLMAMPSAKGDRKSVV